MREERGEISENVARKNMPGSHLCFSHNVQSQHCTMNKRLRHIMGTSVAALSEREKKTSDGPVHQRLIVVVKVSVLIPDCYYDVRL